MEPLHFHMGWQKGTGMLFSFQVVFVLFYPTLTFHWLSMPGHNHFWQYPREGSHPYLVGLYYLEGSLFRCQGEFSTTHAIYE